MTSPGQQDTRAAAPTGTRLKGVHALVTGSSSGIGAAIALRLAQEGADVAVHYRSHPEGASEVLEKIRAAGADGFLVQGDMAKAKEVRSRITRRRNRTRVWRTTR